MAKTGSPATLHFQQLNASTTQQNIKKGGWMRQGKVGKTDRVMTCSFFPHDSRFIISPPFILWNNALFISTLHYLSWLWFILFDVRIYMMPNYNVAVLRPRNSQAPTVRDSSQSVFPTSPLTVWYRESVRFAVRLPQIKVTKTKALSVAARSTVYFVLLT